jgi:hypothetical protein
MYLILLTEHLSVEILTLNAQQAGHNMAHLPVHVLSKPMMAASGCVQQHRTVLEADLPLQTWTFASWRKGLALPGCQLEVQA